MLEYDVRLETTHSSRGGVRWWFLCPLVRDGRPCGRRVQKLYLPPNARQFGCRHCYGLTYQSRRRGARARAVHKAYKIRERLGGDPCMDEKFPTRPPRMWRRKYERLRKQAEHAEEKARRVRRRRDMP